MLDQITDEVRASEEYLRLYDGIGKKYGFKTKTNDYAIPASSLRRMTDEEKEIYLRLPPLR